MDNVSTDKEKRVNMFTVPPPHFPTKREERKERKTEGTREERK